MEENVADLIRKLLIKFGEDPNRDGLIKTHERVEKLYQEVLSGYNESPQEISTTFSNEGISEMIIVKDIEFYSLCEHHIIPFFGSVSIGYIPSTKILGISKFARIAEVFSKRLQVQERLTNQISESLNQILEPQGLAIKIQAKHLCMAMRGIKKSDSTTTTLSFTGIFESNESLREEFLSQV